LSNKRFAGRKRFWNISFFSKTHSFNLEFNLTKYYLHYKKKIL
jgi:hypothetical protein